MSKCAFKCSSVLLEVKIVFKKKKKSKIIHLDKEGPFTLFIYRVERGKSLFQMVKI